MPAFLNCAMPVVLVSGLVKLGIDEMLGREGGGDGEGFLVGVGGRTGGGDGMVDGDGMVREGRTVEGDGMVDGDGTVWVGILAVRTAGLVMAVEKVVWRDRLLKRMSASVEAVALTLMMVLVVMRVDVMMVE